VEGWLRDRSPLSQIIVPQFLEIVLATSCVPRRGLRPVRRSCVPADWSDVSDTTRIPDLQKVQSTPADRIPLYRQPSSPTATTRCSPVARSFTVTLPSAHSSGPTM